VAGVGRRVALIRMFILLVIHYSESLKLPGPPWKTRVNLQWV